MNIDTINTAINDTPPLEKKMPSSVSANIETAQSIQKKQETEKTKEDQKTSLSVKDAKELTQEMNEIMDDLQTSLGFSIREEFDHQVVVEITNRKTNELIKQIPSEELLAIKEKMGEFAGLIFDQSV